jgi:stress-induced morphogen
VETQGVHGSFSSVLSCLQLPVKSSFVVMPREDLLSALTAAFPDSTSLDVVDTSAGCGSSFRVTVVAPSLGALPGPLARQRAVHAALGPALLAGIHALEIKATATPPAAAAAPAAGDASAK